MSRLGCSLAVVLYKITRVFVFTFGNKINLRVIEEKLDKGTEKVGRHVCLSGEGDMTMAYLRNSRAM